MFIRSKFRQSLDEVINEIVNKKVIEGIDGIKHIAIIIPMYKLNQINKNNIIVAENYSLGKGKVSVHAEDSAIRKLRSEPTKRKKIIMIVLRVSKTGVFGMSKPCSHCLWKIQNLIPKKGYILSKLLFSTRENNLEVCPNNNSIKKLQSKVSSFFKQ